jgi:choline-sulfatase
MTTKKLSRRSVLAGVAGISAINILRTPARAAEFSKMNVVIFLTDQQRKIMHFPPGWEEKNLPGLFSLKRHGLSFENAFTNTCMCSPARSTLLTGYFPAQTGVKYTLEQYLTGSRHPQVQLPLPDQIKNIATVMSGAGYNVVYKGKLHLMKYEGKEFVPEDAGKYGFTRWNPPDAGADEAISEAGGGVTNNDWRFIYDNGPVEAGREGVLAYLSRVARDQQPFCLIVSLVNPHDVLFYPKVYLQGNTGYNGWGLTGTIEPPATIGEDLSTKPRVQREFLTLANIRLGHLKGIEMQRSYLNFYGNLMALADQHLRKVLDALDQLGVRDNTLVIQTADHGEMGLAHGGLRQKNFNFYEETMRVPLVYSNPKLYPDPVSSDALVSHVDFLPTLANLFTAPESVRSKWQGVDYSSLVVNPLAQPVQDYTVFTYDDYQSGQASRIYPLPPNHIVSIREQRYKLAEYYDVTNRISSEWEMYDLLHDPLETTNLAAPLYNRTPEQEAEYKRLQQKLKDVIQTRLQPLA